MFCPHTLVSLLLRLSRIRASEDCAAQMDFNDLLMKHDAADAVRAAEEERLKRKRAREEAEGGEGTKTAARKGKKGVEDGAVDDDAEPAKDDHQLDLEEVRRQRELLARQKAATEEATTSAAEQDTVPTSDTVDLSQAVMEYLARHRSGPSRPSTSVKPAAIVSQRVKYTFAMDSTEVAVSSIQRHPAELKQILSRRLFDIKEVFVNDVLLEAVLSIGVEGALEGRRKESTSQNTLLPLGAEDGPASPTTSAQKHGGAIVADDTLDTNIDDLLE